MRGGGGGGGGVLSPGARQPPRAQGGAPRTAGRRARTAAASRRPRRRLLLTRRARIALGTATQCTRRHDSPPPPPPPPWAAAPTLPLPVSPAAAGLACPSLGTPSPPPPPSPRRHGSTTVVGTPRSASARALPGRVHPQFRDNSRHDIGNSQSKWTAYKMKTPGSQQPAPSGHVQHARPSAEVRQPVHAQQPLLSGEHTLLIARSGASAVVG
jgi:hypothetical protein